MQIMRLSVIHGSQVPELRGGSMIHRYLDEQITLTQLAQHYVDAIKALPAYLRFIIQALSIALLVGTAWIALYVSVNLRGWLAEAWEVLQ